MTELPFVHLHCHSDYSILQGAATIHQLVGRAQALGMNALALTDSGNLYGALEFHRHAKSEGIKPILGYEAYIAHGSGFEGQSNNHTLTLLARNHTGFKNLTHLASTTCLDGYNHKPRIDKESLAAHSEGIICLSGGVSGELGQLFLRDDPQDQNLAAACELVAWFKNLFGDDYYIEIQDHGLPSERKANKGAVTMAERMEVKLVVTNDVHYIRREDAIVQDICSCINQGKFLADENRQRLGSDQYYLKNQVEMYKTFSGLEDAVRRSQEIADSVDIDLGLGKTHHPAFPLPEGLSADEELRERCLEGLRTRYVNDAMEAAGGELNAHFMSRLEQELSVIKRLGYSNYFLILWDIVRYARENDIPYTLRGSAVSSLVNYVLFLSPVCPLEHGLLFERFMATDMLRRPDVDLDFCRDRRDEVIEYVRDKYDKNNVACVGMFGRLTPQAAVRDVGRALGIDIQRVDKIVAMVPRTLGMNLAEALEEDDGLRQAFETNEEVQKVIHLAMEIEGLVRNVGVHCAAIVIANQSLTNLIPLCRSPGNEVPITQWSPDNVEAVGLLKLDLLSLTNLTVLSKSVSMVEQTTGQKIDLQKLPLDDAATFALLGRGETKGIFLFNSEDIRDLLQRTKPNHFRDIMAAYALYRPGPLERGMVDNYVAVKQGRKQAVYLHPIIREVLEETHGVVVYQEQVMQILTRLGGIDLSAAYNCVKAICQLKLLAIAKYRQQFMLGAGAQGLSHSEAAALFDMVEEFGGYTFNKSHSAAYALISYQTAYLKTHYPAQFMAALLSSDIPDRTFRTEDAVVEHVEEVRRMGIGLIGPDVNASGVEFSIFCGTSGGPSKATHKTPATPEGGIVIALSAIKWCSVIAAQAIVEERRKGGFYRSLNDFYDRLDRHSVSLITIEALIEAGAFDWLETNRAVAVRELWTMSAIENGSGCEPTVEAEVWDQSERLAREKAVLGFNVSI